MTLSSRYRIRNSSLGGLRPSTLPLGHGGSPQYYFHTWMGEKHFCFIGHASIISVTCVEFGKICRYILPSKLQWHLSVASFSRYVCILKRLHWLPVKFRIHFWIWTITFRTLKRNQPAHWLTCSAEMLKISRPTLYKFKQICCSSYKN